MDKEGLKYNEYLIKLNDLEMLNWKLCKQEGKVIRFKVMQCNRSYIHMMDTFIV